MSVVFILGFISVFSTVNSFADINPETPAVNSVDNVTLSKKLDKITESQSKILNELDELKAELAIVKIRVTQRS